MNALAKSFNLGTKKCIFRGSFVNILVYGGWNAKIILVYVLAAAGSRIQLTSHAAPDLQAR